MPPVPAKIEPAKTRAPISAASPNTKSSGVNRFRIKLIGVSCFILTLMSLLFFTALNKPTQQEENPSKKINDLGNQIDPVLDRAEKLNEAASNSPSDGDSLIKSSELIEGVPKVF
jgi:hypothetical protein